MDFVDYYKIMGLSDKATAEDIRKTYRKLARKYHPDVSREADSEARFKELGEAYAVLKDPQRRAEYDELRRYGGARPGGFQPPPGWQSRAGGGAGRSSGFGGADPNDFSDFFQSIFGQRSPFGASAARPSRPASHRGEDIKARLAVRLRDVYEGATLPLTLRIPVQQQDGRVLQQNRTLQVTIPRGLTHGQKIRLRGQGHSGTGGHPSGDLYIELDIQPDDTFQVDGRDISVTVPVAPWTMALGGQVAVPTLGGTVTLTVPANAVNGQRLRLRGRGLPAPKGTDAAGDQLAILQTVMPPVESDEQRQAVRALAALF